MTDLLLSKKERDLVFRRIETLQSELKRVSDNANYYQDLLVETRRDMIDIFNLSGAKTEVADMETVDDAWRRMINSVKAELKKPKIKG